ncbi:MAG: hypothetical protein ACI4UO_05095, partial [Paludibacteraceae bacterium]
VLVTSRSKLSLRGLFAGGDIVRGGAMVFLAMADKLGYEKVAYDGISAGIITSIGLSKQCEDTIYIPVGISIFIFFNHHTLLMYREKYKKGKSEL